MKIKKKVWKKYFQSIIDGKKNFDLRLDDFKCSEGDILLLEEWDEQSGEYTGRSVEKIVSYVLKTKNLKFWQKEEIEKHGFQIISFK